MIDNRTSRIREALLLFSLIFIITSAAYIYFAETASYPIRMYTAVDKFIPYIVHRKEPFEYFYFAFKHFHSYYLGTFFIITSLYVSLYYYLWSAKRKMPELLKFSILIFGMFTGGFLIYIANNLYIYGFNGDFFSWLINVFLYYLEMLLFKEFTIIMLFLTVALLCMMYIQFLRLRKIYRMERENIRKLEDSEEKVNTKM